MTYKVAILAGGLARRLGKLSNTTPKSLIEVAGKPFAFHQISLLKKHGINEFVYCIGHMGDKIKEYLGDGSELNVHIEYSCDGPMLLGTGGAIKKALPLLGNAFFVLYGDSYLNCDYEAIEKSHKDNNKLGLMTILKNNNQWDRSNIQQKNGQIVRYDKDTQTPNMEYIDYGLSIFNSAAFYDFNNQRKFDLSLVFQNLIKKEQLASYEVYNRFYEIGSLKGKQELEKYLDKQS